MTCLSSPITATVLSALFVFTAIFLAFWLPARKIYHLMDPGDKPGAFEPHIKRYQELARLVLTLATASAAFLMNLIVNPPVKHATSDTAATLLNAAPQAILFLCAAVFFLLLFMTALDFFTRIILTSITSPQRPRTSSVALASIVAGSTPSC